MAVIMGHVMKLKDKKRHAKSLTSLCIVSVIIGDSVKTVGSCLRIANNDDF